MSGGDIPVDDTISTGERKMPKGAELYADWMERMQRGRGRHAAISRNLSSWSNYKNWADKMSGSWAADTNAALKKKKYARERSLLLWDEIEEIAGAARHAAVM